MADARQSLAGDLDQIERLIVSPAADIIELLDRIKKLITKRAHKLLDYDDNRTTLQSLREKASRTVSEEKKMAQIEVQYETAAREYESINGILKRDLAVFLGLRQEFVDPILFTYYKYQLKVYQTLYSVYYEIANAQCDLSCTALTGYEIHQSRVSQMLADIKICAASNRTSFQAQNAEHAIVSNGSLNGSNNALPAYTEVPTNYSTAKATQDVTRGMAATSLSALPPPPARRSMEVPRTQYVIALYDFQAQADGDLTFRKDDKIELVERKENVNDWWIGRLGNQIGQFPGNYVKLLN